MATQTPSYANGGLTFMGGSINGSVGQPTTLGGLFLTPQKSTGYTSAPDSFVSVGKVISSTNSYNIQNPTPLINPSKSQTTNGTDITNGALGNLGADLGNFIGKLFGNAGTGVGQGAGSILTAGTNAAGSLINSAAQGVGTAAQGVGAGASDVTGSLSQPLTFGLIAAAVLGVFLLAKK